ncbi:UNKNOWN [Stylonychia lemnae]|uniref:Uncharacterized protein n=1 Tax=Stylonychia lemnae TaxID=5949 RepID=A0A078AMN1_STYLE|nr:UNKNOWN [Stylonychia lemnae]|eukprot:CDW83655.1 UNKNOWN [Stylonychia lemnae]
MSQLQDLSYYNTSPIQSKAPKIDLISTLLNQKREIRRLIKVTNNILVKQNQKQQFDIQEEDLSMKYSNLRRENISIEMDRNEFTNSQFKEHRYGCKELINAKGLSNGLKICSLDINQSQQFLLPKISSFIEQKGMRKYSISDKRNSTLTNQNPSSENTALQSQTQLFKLPYVYNKAQGDIQNNQQEQTEMVRSAQNFKIQLVPLEGKQKKERRTQFQQRKFQSTPNNEINQNPTMLKVESILSNSKLPPPPPLHRKHDSTSINSRLESISNISSHSTTRKIQNKKELGEPQSGRRKYNLQKAFKVSFMSRGGNRISLAKTKSSGSGILIT